MNIDFIVHHKLENRMAVILVTEVVLFPYDTDVSDEEDE